MIVIVAMSAAIGVASLAIVSSGLLDGQNDTRPVDYSAQLVDGNDLPETYTGQLVDLDLDERPDVALFGDPAAPTIEPFDHSKSNPYVPLYAGLLTASIVALSSIVSPIVGAWAKQRWPGKSRKGDDDD